MVYLEVFNCSVIWRKSITAAREVMAEVDENSNKCFVHGWMSLKYGLLKVPLLKYREGL